LLVININLNYVIELLTNINLILTIVPSSLILRIFLCAFPPLKKFLAMPMSQSEFVLVSKKTEIVDYQREF